jgi:hypothetical protein
MRRKVHKVYDEYVASGANGVTSSSWNDVLGSLDCMGFEVVVDDASANATLDVWLDHSGDSRLWLPARSVPSQTPPFYVAGTGDVTSSITTGTGNVVIKNYADGWHGISKTAGTPIAHGPLLAFVRLQIGISAGTAHFKIHAFQRDGY